METVKNKKRILAISGSTRRNSSNELILKFIGQHYADVLEVELYEGIDLLPHFNPDLVKENPPAVVIEFREKIQAADGILICTPEYVFSLPGSMKNALEWTVSTTVFSDKPTAFIVASASGAEAFQSLNLILTTIQAKIALDSRLLIQGVKGKVGPLGQINDSATRQGIDTLVNSLLNSID
ncbi:NADPH-dependent FMN reductase [Salmonirosea aquatica]|uniref:FMN reductase n=1 Tax=Salmonirosea aquatica TaxID=2654236 RepID=A0A7C9FFV5_9BACT|nr:FMN reductase [Cytophagaceae bacterium SJW1-29]